MTKPLKAAERAMLADGYCTLAPVRPNGQKAKRGWRTKSRAKRAMRVIAGRTEAKGESRPRSVYLCRCGLWHLSSMAPSDSAS